MDAPFDRGEIDRASLDATERLRARLAGERKATPARPARSSLPWVLAGGLFVFTAGMIANPWFEANVRGRLPFAQAAAPAPTEVVRLRQRVADLQAGTATQAAPPSSERLAATEARIEINKDQIARDAERIDKLTADVAAIAAGLAADRGRTEAATAAATASAERAQALLTLLLVRRAIDTGRPLGPLEPALRQAFEARYPEALKPVLALGAAPVTPASLARDFDALRPAIGAAGTASGRQDWWQIFTATLTAGLSRPVAAPQAPVEAAAAAMARGDVLAAANHLRRLPPPRRALVTAWLAAAARLQAGSQGLATLESGALLVPVLGPIPGIAPPNPAALPPQPAQTPAATRAAPANGHISTAFLQVYPALARVRDMLQLPRLAL
jgi:hypothetical protein